ncbi:hypothetical protein [Ornithinimicrobium tianjinense]|nr:hypothetical protein [Ornithinimicrobium tianjinense]
MRRLPVWGWILLAFVTLRVAGELDIPVLPLLVLGWVAYTVWGHKLGRGRSGRPGGTLGRVERPQGVAWPQETSRPTSPGPLQPDSPMPTIDVPRYPGAAGQGMSSLGSDPAVSLAQLQLGQVGRDLDQAAGSGDDSRVEQALRRAQSTVQQVKGSLEVAGSPEASRLRASLDGLGGAVARALAETPGPGRSSLVQRIIQTCRGPAL